MDKADRIRLEERARILAQASEEVNKMLRKFSTRDDKSKTNQNKGTNMKTHQNQRGSKSFSNLNISDTSTRGSNPRYPSNKGSNQQYQKKDSNNPQNLSGKGNNQQQFSNKGNNPQRPPSNVNPQQFLNKCGGPQHSSNKGNNPQYQNKGSSNPQNISGKGHNQQQRRPSSNVNPQQFLNKGSGQQHSSNKGSNPKYFVNKSFNSQQFSNKGGNPQNFSKNSNVNSNFNAPPPSYNDSVRHYGPRNYHQAMPRFQAPFPYMNQQPVPQPLIANPPLFYPPNIYNQLPLQPVFSFTNLQQQQHGFQSSNQSQPQQQQAPKPLPRKSLKQEEKNENKPAPPQSGSSNKTIATHIDVNMLTRELSNFNGFFTSIETLAKIAGRDYNEVATVIDNNRKTFSMMKDDSENKTLVELCPQIKICYDHIGIGCFKPQCFSLHICAHFINDKCQSNDCSYGHVWKSDHNNPILHKFFIALLPNTMLHSLIKKVLCGTVIPEICSDYIENKCQNDENCSKLHICNSYVDNLGNCSNGADCSLNHNIRDSKCTKIFQNFGISTNESPRDLLKILRDRCLGRKQDNKSKDVPLKQTSVSDLKSKTKDINKRKKDVDSNSESDKNKTICCWQLYGNIDEPKICIDGIKTNCKFISSGCKYLHCKHKSHWQFGEGNTWYNFHLYHSQILDTKYSDISCDDMVLYKLDSKRVHHQQKSLFDLMGDQKCKIDFINMKMDCSGVKKIYSIRNLTTESSVLCSDQESTIFKWYFLDDGEKWMLYGSSELSSNSIEKAYLDKPSGTYKFPSSNFVYLIDFSKMTQENLSTKKVRNIKRRPFIYQETSGAKEKFEVPQHWEKMTDKEEYKLVMLSSGHEEYLDIRQRLSLTLPMIKILNISRIQNTHLWKQFKNKQTELEKKYDDKFLNIQKLFHGIDSKNLTDICRDNLEFRLHGNPSVNMLYGEGTYFYNSASIAAQSCVVDFMKNKTLLVVDVIIGKLAAGSKGITRPPANPVYGDALYDTTSDKVDCPTVFVKYNRQEYYPAYVVEFQ